MVRHYIVTFFVLFMLVAINTGVSESRENLISYKNSPADAGLSQAKSHPAIPDVLILTAPEKDTKYVILVEKDSQQLFLYAYAGTFRELYRMNCSTGKVRGDKSVSGDMKTPEGVYFITRQIPKRDLAPTYGTRAFPIDYPNSFDRTAGRGGHSIWLHGTNKPLKSRDSNGCIALANSDIDKLAKYITVNKTPVIIVDKLRYRPAESKNEAATSIINFLSQWNNALKNGSYHEYLKFYDDEFLPDISWWPEWSKIRKTLQKSYLPFSVDLKKTSIFKYKEIFVILSDLIITSSGKTFNAGTQKFFVSDKGAQFRIVCEKHLSWVNGQNYESQKNPLIAICRELKGLPKEEDQDIPNMIDGWLQAWSAKDIKRYGDYYASNFRSQGGASLKNWLKYKERLNQKYDYIRVSMNNLVINKGKNTCQVSFIQTYESSSLKATGLKQLTLIREGGLWKIYKETWKKK